MTAGRLRDGASMQAELSIDRVDLRRLDQSRMGDGDRVQRAIERALPEVQKLVQLRKGGTQIVVLPNIGL
jgi:hypothetical protein